MIFRFDKYLTGDQIESLNAEIDKNSPHQLVLKISRFKNARLFANSRLLSLLLKCHQKQIDIIIDTAQYRDNFFSKYKNKNFFLNSTTGFIVTAFSNRITDDRGSHLKKLILQAQLKELAKTENKVTFEGETKQIKKKKGFIVSGNEKTGFYYDGLDKPEKAAIFQASNYPEKVTDFNSDFTSILSKLGLNIPKHYSKIELISSNIGFEAVQNVIEHALMDLNDKPINQLQFVHFHRININSYSSKIDYIIEDKKTPVTNYINHIRKKFNFNEASEFEANLYEISISDSGIGIPAKLAGTLDVYNGEIKKEKKLLIKALQEAISSKPRKTEDIGFGLPKIMQAVKKSDGLIVFRTGRLLMYRHFLNSRMDNLSMLSDWDSKVRNYLPGTSISILFPIFNSKSAKQTNLF